MRIGIATAQVPFVRGGAELQAEALKRALQAAGHEAEIISVPFKWYPLDRIPRHMLACRLLPVDEFCSMKIDRLIALKFPAYFMPHPHKVLWLTHQHRTAYDTWDSPIGDIIDKPEGAHIRQLIKTADEALIPECRSIYTISKRVAERLAAFNGIQGIPLYHPPPFVERFSTGNYEDYFLAPSRINESKRQHLILEALAHTHYPVKVRFFGSGDGSRYSEELKQYCSQTGIADRVDWLGDVDDDNKIALYANCRAVIFPPIDEDYGYVTLEAMASAKAVITCNDSGGPLEFIVNQKTGIVCSPDARSLANALDRLWTDNDTAMQMGQGGREHFGALKLSWNSVLTALLG